MVLGEGERCDPGARTAWHRHGPYSPLGKGFLTGTIDTTTTFASTDMRARTPRFQGEALKANLALVEVLNRIAAEVSAPSCPISAPQPTRSRLSAPATPRRTIARGGHTTLRPA